MKTGTLALATLTAANNNHPRLAQLWALDDKFGRGRRLNPLMFSNAELASNPQLSRAVGIVAAWSIQSCHVPLSLKEAVTFRLTGTAQLGEVHRQMIETLATIARSEPEEITLALNSLNRRFRTLKLRKAVVHHPVEGLRI